MEIQLRRIRKRLGLEVHGPPGDASLRYKNLKVAVGSLSPLQMSHQFSFKRSGKDARDSLSDRSVLSRPSMELVMWLLDYDLCAVIINSANGDSRSVRKVGFYTNTPRSGHINS